MVFPQYNYSLKKVTCQMKLFLSKIVFLDFLVVLIFHHFKSWLLECFENIEPKKSYFT